MPYSIKKFPDGYRVVSPNHPGGLSKDPKSLEAAKKHLQAIRIHYQPADKDALSNETASESTYLAPINKSKKLSQESKPAGPTTGNVPRIQFDATGREIPPAGSMQDARERIAKDLIRSKGGPKPPPVSVRGSGSPPPDPAQEAERLKAQEDLRLQIMEENKKKVLNWSGKAVGRALAVSVPLMGLMWALRRSLRVDDGLKEKKKKDKLNAKEESIKSQDMKLYRQQGAGSILTTRLAQGIVLGAAASGSRWVFNHMLPQPEFPKLQPPPTT
jgi:hypothetical protein